MAGSSPSIRAPNPCSDIAGATSLATPPPPSSPCALTPPAAPPRPAPPAEVLPPELMTGEPQVRLGRRADGSVFAVDVLVTKVEAALSIVSFRNVEARAAGEEELRASEARVRGAGG